jgi:hypothetical protein
VRSWSRHSVSFGMEEPTAQFLVKMPVEAEGDGVGRMQGESALHPFVVAELDRKGEKDLANSSISMIPEFRLTFPGEAATCSIYRVRRPSSKTDGKRGQTLRNPAKLDPHQATNFCRGA